jgi:hypothetical protein
MFAVNRIDKKFGKLFAFDVEGLTKHHMGAEEKVAIGEFPGRIHSVKCGNHHNPYELATRLSSA